MFFCFAVEYASAFLSGANQKFGISVQHHYGSYCLGGVAICKKDLSPMYRIIGLREIYKKGDGLSIVIFSPDALNNPPNGQDLSTNKYYVNIKTCFA